MVCVTKILLKDYRSVTRKIIPQEVELNHDTFNHEK